MIEFNHSENLNHCIEHLFGIVLDIERYPEFVPNCESIEILEREENEMKAKVHTKIGMISSSYISNIEYQFPRNGKAYIYVRSIDGPFQVLANEWKFIRINDSTTCVEFSIRFKLKNPILHNIVNSMSGDIHSKMLAAFKRRAQDLVND